MDSNKIVREKLTLLYGCRCMLTGIKTDKLSYHHINKKEHGGKATVDNGVNLLEKIHKWLHNNIEHNDKELFLLINECLLLYKKCLDIKNNELIRQYEEECMPFFVEKIRER